VRPLLRRIPGLGEREIDLAEGVRYAPRAGAERQRSQRPDVLRAGGSCGHPHITAGTLGAFVEDDRRYYALSNNHVLADCDQASVGDEIWQPGPYDVKRAGHQVIAHLSRCVPLDPFRTDGVDAAIAELDGEVPEFLPWEYDGIGEMDPHPIDDRFAVRRVIKRGRTTEVTRGRVSAFELDGVQLDYGTRLDSRIITYDDQLEFVHVSRSRAFSQGGDSGSLILDQATLRPYALLYGGGPDAEGIDRTLAHFLPSVLTRLRVRMVSP
ncbi:MAG: trypsin-like peptidase domain-containing protein, partial [Candidatus Eisenbacteria bacterium]